MNVRYADNVLGTSAFASSNLKVLRSERREVQVLIVICEALGRSFLRAADETQFLAYKGARQARTARQAIEGLIIDLASKSIRLALHAKEKRLPK